jgi:hypothetical protein
MSVEEDKTLFDRLVEKLKGFVGGTLIPTVNETQRQIPDSILMGSIILYILTQNYSYGIFSLFIFEIITIHLLIGKGMSMYSGSTSLSPDSKCRTGYRSYSSDVSKILSQNTFPSMGMYSITAIATYIGAAMTSLKTTLDAMGTEWSSRYTVAAILIPLFVVTFAAFQLMKGCDSMTDILIASVIGAIVGILFFTLHSALFGAEAINLLGIPLLVDKEDEGKPLYVCVKQQNA